MRPWFTRELVGTCFSNTTTPRKLGYFVERRWDIFQKPLSFVPMLIFGDSVDIIFSWGLRFFTSLQVDLFWNHSLASKKTEVPSSCHSGLLVGLVVQNAVFWRDGCRCWDPCSQKSSRIFFVFTAFLYVLRCVSFCNQNFNPDIQQSTFKRQLLGQHDQSASMILCIQDEYTWSSRLQTDNADFWTAKSWEMAG